MNIEIERDERLFFTGKTGSGKTEAILYLASHYPDVVVLDNKGLFGTDRRTREFWVAKHGYGLCTDLDDIHVVAEDYRKIIFRPPVELESNQNDFRECMDAFFWWIYQRENTICIVDEATAVCTSSFILPGHNALMKRGRELNIGCWNASQQPVNCHNTLISEADHYFMFQVALQSHRDKMAGFTGEIVRNKFPRGYEYHSYYYNHTIDDPVLIKPLPMIERR